MIRIVILSQLLIVSDAAAHCYKIWKYPWAQRCHVTALVIRLPPAREELPFPLPDLTGAWGEEADEYTKARLLLRVLMNEQGN